MNELTVIEQDTQLLLDSREAADMTNVRHSDLLEKIDGYIRHLTSGNFRSLDFFIPSTYLDAKGEARPCYKITKKGCEMVANKMTGRKGVLFTAAYVIRFEQMENRIRQINPALKESFEMQLIGVEYTSKILRVDDTSKIRMLEAAHKQHHVPTNHLPAYVDEEVTKSLSALLKENGFATSSTKVNKRMIELGLLEVKERQSSTGKMKKFNSITDSGLKFGKNLINPKSPKETQPHYYPSKFLNLMELLETEASV